MNSVIATAILAVAANAHAAVPTVTTEHMEAFKLFQTKFGKKYSSDSEWAERAGIFAQNLETVHMRNKAEIMAGGDAVHGVTKFMDLTPDEFSQQYMGYIARNESKVIRTDVHIDGPLADDVDWRTKGAVTEVKDQGQCGSCWAFSATEAIESYAFLSGAKLQKLSAQQITSCDKVDQGCNGGNTETAYAYVKGTKGLETESNYPYTSGTGKDGICKATLIKEVQPITGFTSVTKGESNLQTALNDGPVSICVAANAFQTYTSGILKICPGSIDHCVQAVGYSTSDKYWIVRNSWNTDWGEEGYIRVAMGYNACKISNDVTFPTFK